MVHKQHKKIIKKKKQTSNGIIKIVSAGIVAALVLIFLLFAPQPTYKTGYSTIDQLEEFGKTRDEWIKMEGANYFKPVYEKYYAAHFGKTFLSNITGRFKWLWSWMPFSSKPLFSASYFKFLLDENNKIRQAKGYKGQFIQKITISVDTLVAVFGEIQGGFHNLIRYLKKLRELGFISNDFKIAPNRYFLFQGDVVNRSPYTLELFSILLKLLKENPDQVVYLKGEQEDYKVWSEDTLRRELEIRASNLSSTKIPLENEVKTFFDSLPLVIYCPMTYMKHEKLPYFKMRPYTAEGTIAELTEDKNYASFLLAPQKNSIDTYSELTKGSGGPDSDKIQLMAIIDGIKKRVDWAWPMEGLRLLPKIDDVIRWYIFSSTFEPIRMVKFFHDAFCVITPAEKVDDWKITLYNRDTRNREDLEFKKHDFHFFTGEEFGKEGQQPAAEVPIAKPAEKVVQQTTVIETKTTKTAVQEVAPTVKLPEQKVADQKTPEAKTPEQKPAEAKAPESKPAEKVVQQTTVTETKTTQNVVQAAAPTLNPSISPGGLLRTEQKAVDQKIPEAKAPEQKPAEIKLIDKPVEQKMPEKAPGMKIAS